MMFIQVETYVKSSMKDWPLRGMSLSYAVDVMRRHNYDFVAFGFHDAVFVHHSLSRVYSFVTPYDEYDCYHQAFIMSNGIPIRSTRRWFYKMNKYDARIEIFDYLTKYSLQESNYTYAFPFTLA
jgi:hypothetical protein